MKARAASLLLALSLGLAAGLPAGDPTPVIRGHFNLIDAQSGKHVSQASYAGSYRLVFFGFTHCPLTCPVGLHTLATVLAKLGPDAAKVKALFITIDPKRDTAKAVVPYLAGIDPRITGLVGSQKAISAAMRDFRLEAEPMGKDEDYVFEHPAIIYVMGKKGEYLATVPSSGDAAKITQQVKTTLGL